MIADEQRRTKDLLTNLLPHLPSNGPTEFNKWLEFITSFIKNERKEAAAITHSNNHNNSRVNNSKDVASVNGNEESNSTSSSSNASGGDVNNSCEVLLLQNAQLQKSLDEYKSIVADTVSSYFQFFL